jgi:hypothetical protein
LRSAGFVATPEDAQELRAGGVEQVTVVEFTAE